MNSRTAARIAHNAYRQYGATGMARIAIVTFEHREVLANPFTRSHDR